MPWSDWASGVSPSIVNLVRACAAFVVALASVLAAAADALAASPTPTPVSAGDPRSSGVGPGLVGDPLAALVIVAAIAVLSVGATLLYVHVTTGRNRGSPS